MCYVHERYIADILHHGYSVLLEADISLSKSAAVGGRGGLWRGRTKWLQVCPSIYRILVPKSGTRFDIHCRRPNTSGMPKARTAVSQKGQAKLWNDKGTDSCAGQNDQDDLNLEIPVVCVSSAAAAGSTRLAGWGDDGCSWCGRGWAGCPARLPKAGGCG